MKKFIFKCVGYIIKTLIIVIACSLMYSKTIDTLKEYKKVDIEFSFSNISTKLKLEK